MTPDAPAVDDAPRIPCYACAEPVHPDARKCRWCGEWYEDIVRSQQRVTASQAHELLASADSDADSGLPHPFDRDLSMDDLVVSSGDEWSDDLASLESVRHEIATAFGIVIPELRLRHDAELVPGEARIRIREVAVDAVTYVAGDHTALVEGVVESLSQRLGDFVTRELVADLLNRARSNSPMVVQELVPNLLSVGQLAQVLRNLLRETIPIRDLSTIFNALADNAVYTKDPHALTEHVRSRLARTICSRYEAGDGFLKAFMLSPDAERAIQNSIQLNETGQVLMIDPNTSHAIQENFADALKRHAGKFDVPVVMTPPKIRRHVKELLGTNFLDVVVLSYSEIVAGVQIDNLEMIEASNRAHPPSDHPSSGIVLGSVGHSDWLMSDDVGPDAPPIEVEGDIDDEAMERNG
jgi:flagellar biosynthesis component FlhA